MKKNYYFDLNYYWIIFLKQMLEIFLDLNHKMVYHEQNIFELEMNQKKEKNDFENEHELLLSLIMEEFHYSTHH